MAVELRGMAGTSADTSSATPALRTANDSAMKDDPPRDSPFIRPRLARSFLMRNRVVRQFFYRRSGRIAAAGQLFLGRAIQNHTYFLHPDQAAFHTPIQPPPNPITPPRRSY